MNCHSFKSSIYEIKVNPFRSELAIIKSDIEKSELNLQSQVMIQIDKEFFLGQVIKIKSLSPLLPDIKCNIIRLASNDDLVRKKILNKKSEETKMFFEDLLKKFKILAKIVLIDWDFSQHKVYCYLTSERKINYLLLHETAVVLLKSRVAIKQIGVRDFARSIGGLGVCGRELCCRVFLQNIQPVTLTSARRQNIYVEPEKISGCCGKLRCCIAYEQ